MIDKFKEWWRKLISKENIKRWLRAYGLAVGILGGLAGLVWLLWLIWEWMFVVAGILAGIIVLAILIKRYL